MGALKDQVSEQIKAAMKARDKVRLNALRYLKKLFIENDTSGNPIDEQDIVISYAKKVKDSISMYPEDSPQRKELAQEVDVLQEFLPKQMTEKEVGALITQIKSSQAGPNMGSVMKELTPRIKGRFDGKKASQMVKEALA